MTDDKEDKKKQSRKNKKKKKHSPLSPSTTPDPKAKKSHAKSKKKEKKFRLRHIPIHSTIDTSFASYVVMKQLSVGRFGGVYEAYCLKTRGVYAIKVESMKKGEDCRLKKEFEIYRRITHAKNKNEPRGSHLLGLIDYGEVPDLLSFMFMPLCGESLNLFVKRKEAPTTNIAIILADQTLRAIQNFHSFKLIHRDIKPASFVVGRCPNDNVVFLIGFGMAVRYCKDADTMPKSSAHKFIGKKRYASRTSHQGNVQTRKDDLESWMYVAMEFFNIDVLLWAPQKDQKIVQRMKELLFEEKSTSMFSCLPSCFVQIAGIIDAIKPFEKPKYEAIHELLQKLAQEKGTEIDGPLRGFTDKAETPLKKDSDSSSLDKTPDTPSPM